MADPNEPLQPETQSDVMPDLPGSGTPPIDGRSWVLVKILVWMVACIIGVALAWGVASMVTKVVA